MDLFDLAGPEQIELAEFPTERDGLLPYLRARKPVLLNGVREHLPCARDWNYEYFRRRLESIRIQRPSADGIYHYLGFQRIPLAEFDELLHGTGDGYALEPLKGRGVAQSFPEDLRVDLPAFVPEEGFRVSNLYVGPGGNRSLLHYDETHSLLMMMEGRKRFILFPPSQSGLMYPYSFFNVRALLENRVVDSRVDCSAPDFERFPGLKRARGIAGWLEDGQALFIPAGTWHYIEAEGLNVSVNFFWLENRLRDWMQRPLIDFWFKRRAIDGLDMARRVKHAIDRRREATT
ncbi:cupin-like domain-containing protein [Lentisalinibacter sediminis]|uniref:cupin-like domain-containing protein n=1 Tax=Lentisalinibacter sediminis TaxID=2992237 RepID=UPI003870CD98